MFRKSDLSWSIALIGGVLLMPCAAWGDGFTFAYAFGDECA